MDQQQQHQQIVIQQQLQLQDQQRQQQMQLLMLQRQQQEAPSLSPFPAAARSSLNHHHQFQFQSQSPPPQQQIPNFNQNPNSVGVALVNRSPPKAEFQLAYQDLLRVCNPDFDRPFSSLEDACERLLPYHVVADYDAEEDDSIIDSDTTDQMLSRSQQWEQNVAAKVAEYSATFEKQVHAFNVISRKHDHGEFRSEERLMLEKNLLQEERQSVVELRAEWESRQN